METNEFITKILDRCNKVELSHGAAVLWDGDSVKAELSSDWYEMTREIIQDGDDWIEVSSRYGGLHYGRQHLWVRTKDLHDVSGLIGETTGRRMFMKSPE